MRLRRSVYEIVWSILVYCREPRKATHIATACNLNTKSLRKYLEMLTSRGLLARDGDAYVTTERGLRYIELFERIYRLIFSD